MTTISWPADWQEAARDAVTAHADSEVRLRIVVGDPATSLDGSVIEGFVHLTDAVPVIVFDNSGAPNVRPWPLLPGPVLRVYQLRPRRTPLCLFAHSGWTPRHGD